MMLKSVKISFKLMGLVIILASLSAVVGYVGYYFNSKAVQSAQGLYEDNLVSIQDLNILRANTRAVEGDTIELVSANVTKMREQQLAEEIQQRVKQNDNIIAEYEKKGKIDSYEAERLPQLKQELQLFRSERQKALSLSAAGKREEAYAYFIQNVVPHYEKYNEYLVDLAKYNMNQAVDVNKANVENAAFANKIIVTIPVVTMIIGIVLGWGLVRMISSRLNNTILVAEQVASGDLSQKKLEVYADDEIGALGKALNTMHDNLRNLVKEVSASVDQVASSSEQLTASSEQSAHAAVQIAESIAETAQDIDKQNSAVGNALELVKQISSGTRQGADSATDAAGLTGKAVAATQTGDKAIEATIIQMEHIQETINNSAKVISELGEQSQEIGKIVEAITNIASQTNLLALNAAIEAARAGEHGKGFSVVAEEVRKLAEQSQESAKQIANLISNIQTETEKAVKAMIDGKTEVNKGREVVHSAGDAFKEIDQSVQQVAVLAEGVAATLNQLAATSQQTVAEIQEIGKVSKQISSESQTISAATEEQTASMEEVAAGSRNLSTMAQRLQDEIRKFKL